MNTKNKAKRGLVPWRFCRSTGFTLIELLVVIAIIAILMVTVVITLNPTELLKQSRDSNRLSDMATLKTALSLYTADVVTSTGLGTKLNCYSYQAAGAAGATSSCTGFAGITTWVVTNVRNVTGTTGWLPVNFSAISSGAPFSQLPIDPSAGTSGSNTSTYYSYTASGTLLWKLDAIMESTKFKANGTADMVSTDGGTDSSTYEVGTAMGGSAL